MGRLFVDCRRALLLPFMGNCLLAAEQLGSVSDGGQKLEGVFPPLKQQGRYEVCHQHDREHSDNGDFRQRVQGRMFGKDECADADEHYQCGKDDAALVWREDRTFVYVFRDAAFRHENGVVVALAEDECGKDDVDDVELDAQNGHNAQNPYPADCHRYEGNDGKFNATE